MKRFGIKQGCVAMLCLVAAMGFVGCDDDHDGNKSTAPIDINGAWTSSLTGTDENGNPFDYQGTMTIAQIGQDVTGSYSYYNGNTFTFTGTYVDGAMTAIDSDNWSINLEFEEDSAAGTIAGTHENGVAGVEILTLARQNPT